MNHNEILARFPHASKDFIRRNLEAGGVSSSAVIERSSTDEPVAAEAGKSPDAKRHSVCITSFRVRLCDERNLYDKYFTDTLAYAGTIHGDSPKEIEIQVRQEQVSDAGLERTEIEITPL